MKIKKSKLVEVLRSHNINEGLIAKLINTVLAQNTSAKMKIKDKEIAKAEKTIVDLFKNAPQLSDEERKELEKSLGI
tara:strand:- start:1308 stop:1538 length:231 start_codon:yes stop_codon:yes gene_type:complete